MLALSGCNESHNPENPVENLGLQETTRGRQLVEDAVAKANAILGSRDGRRFRGSWQAVSVQDPKNEFVPIYLISPGSISSIYSIMVPTQCGCVFVQPSALEAWIAKYSTASSAMLSVEPPDIVAFMLLHELGHLEKGDPGQFDDVAGQKATNLDQTDQKLREQNADDFAVEKLLAAAADMDAVDGWLDAMNMQMALTNISWNLATIRVLNNVGASLLCTQAVFQDSGYSHPNFELRMLYVRDRLSNTPESRQLLASFEACRTKRTPMSVLGATGP